MKFFRYHDINRKKKAECPKIEKVFWWRIIEIFQEINMFLFKKAVLLFIYP
jgi:hypothetical protein